MKIRDDIEGYDIVHDIHRESVGEAIDDTRQLIKKYIDVGHDYFFIMTGKGTGKLDWAVQNEVNLSSDAMVHWVDEDFSIIAVCLLY